MVGRMTSRLEPEGVKPGDGGPIDEQDLPPGFGPRRLGNPNVNLLSDLSAMAGGYRTPPWYQSKRLFAVAAIAVIVVLAVWGIIGVLRGAASGGGGDTPAESPATGQPSPVSAPVEGRRGEPIVVAPSTPPAAASPAATAEQLRPREVQRIRSP